MLYATMEVNMRIRSFLTSGYVISGPEEERQFVQDVLFMLQGPLDIGAIEKLRNSDESISGRRRMKLINLQMSTKPISGREFCLEALAFGCDRGIDICSPRIQAIGLALHPRVGKDSRIGRLPAEIFEKIVWMSFK